MQDGAIDMKRAAPLVAVVGLGKIGLPLAVQYARRGRAVIGCDINPGVVETINAGKSHVCEEAGLADEVRSLVSMGLLSATQDTVWAVRQADVVVVIVPVIVDEQHRADFEWIDAATASIGEGLRPGTLVIYETTLPVGTTAQRFRPILEHASHLQAGKDFYLAYSPERVSSGHIFRDLQNYPKVVGGIDAASTAAAVSFYRSVLDAGVISMFSTNDAEFVKLIETTYRDVNIALANEYARYADAHGLDVAAAIAAANTQPYSHIHTPGVGVGGHCIPVYPYFLMQGLHRGRAGPGGAAAVALALAARRAPDQRLDGGVRGAARRGGGRDTERSGGAHTGRVLSRGCAGDGLYQRETAAAGALASQCGGLRRGPALQRR